MDPIYKKLRRHLNTMPVGYTRTPSGVEFSLLQKMFTEEQAEIALYMDHTYKTVDELFSSRQKGRAVKMLSASELSEKLDAMASRGCILSKEDGTRKSYALVPFVVGMYELQNPFIDPQFYRDTAKYFRQGFAIDYLTTAVPQMRVVPIEKSITSETKVNTYDNIRSLIENTPKGIAVVECICKKANGLVRRPCTKSSSIEVCLALHDLHDACMRDGWGRTLTKNQALAIIDQAEKDGLVVQTANEQDPQFICLCCSCCCGVLTMYNAVPRPRDFVATNFYAEVDAELCIGCSLCVPRCNMDAIEVVNKKAVIKKERCIGCGLCVTSCKPRAIELKEEDTITVPPRDTEELYDIIDKKKRIKLLRIFTMIKAFMGFKT